jgi:hypothetical protein
VTARGNAQGDIYLSDEDRFKFLSLLNKKKRGRRD